MKADNVIHCPNQRGVRMGWSAQSLQLVIFCQPKLAPPDALQPWFKLFGASPENFQKASLGSPQEQSTALGAVGDYNFMIAASQGRYDLMLSAGDPQLMSGSPPLFADIDKALGVLIGHGNSLIDFQPASRLAIVAQLQRLTDSEAAAAQQFHDLIGMQFAPSKAIDLSFQVNVRKDTAAGPQLNRLCRWHTQTQQLMFMPMDPVSGPAPRVASTFHGVGFMIDVNTLPGSEEFERQKSRALVDEIASEIKSIISGGYRYVVG